MWILLENIALFLAMTDFWLLSIHTQVLLVLFGLVLLALVIRLFVNLYDYIKIGTERRLELKSKARRFWGKSA